MTNNLPQETVVAIKNAVTSALRASSISFVQPRRMNEHDAAAYVGRSFYWLRNLRRADDERVANGGERRGPRYYRDGKSPLYYLEDLNIYLDKKKGDE